MPTRTFNPIFGKRIRITPLDECGNYPAPAAEQGFLSTDGFVTVTLSAEVESGTEIITRKASGALCVNARQPDIFKRFTVGISFCGVDPDALAAVTNAQVYATAEDVANGITIPEGMVDSKFALELWTGLSGAGCEPGVEEASGYLLLPFVNGGTLGDLTVGGTDAINFEMGGGYTVGGNVWGVGPYEVATAADGGPAFLPTALDPLDHLLLVDTDIAPPPVAEGWQPMPAAPAAP